MAERAADGFGLGPTIPDEDQYLTVEEAAAFLDQWANNWNYPPLLKPKGLPPMGGQPKEPTSE